jgi:ubiquinone/menaquinone biosynthesis C-methylase UbiE
MELKKTAHPTRSFYQPGAKAIRQDKMAEKNSWVVEEIRRYGVHDPYDESLYLEVIKKILRAIGSRQKLHILDLGCGSSAYGIRFARLDHDVVGVDISKEATDSAKARAKHDGVKARFYTQDIEKLTFKDSSFDVCFFGGVLHHFPSLELVLGEARRVLKKGGFIVCVEPNRENPHVYLSMEPRSPFRYKHLTPNERSIHFRELLDCPSLKGHIAKHEVFYKLMTLSKKGRHEKSSFAARKILYDSGGFALKYVKGGIFRRLAAIIAYDLVHLWQKFGPDNKRCNFVVLIMKMR